MARRRGRSRRFSVFAGPGLWPFGWSGLRRPLVKDLTIYGDGTQTRSFCYVDDLVDGLVRLMDSGPGFTGPVNLGNPAEFTMLELAETVLELVGQGGSLRHEPLPEDDPRQRQPDITLAQHELGWEPRTDLETGLKSTIAYFDELLREQA